MEGRAVEFAAALSFYLKETVGRFPDDKNYGCLCTILKTMFKRLN